MKAGKEEDACFFKGVKDGCSRGSDWIRMGDIEVARGKKLMGIQSCLFKVVMQRDSS